MKNLFTLNYIGQALLAMLLIQQVDAQVTQFYKRPVSDSTLSEGFFFAWIFFVVLQE